MVPASNENRIIYLDRLQMNAHKTCAAPIRCLCLERRCPFIPSILPRTRNGFYWWYSKSVNIVTAPVCSSKVSLKWGSKSIFFEWFTFIFLAYPIFQFRTTFFANYYIVMYNLLLGYCLRTT